MIPHGRLNEHGPILQDRPDLTPLFTGETMTNKLRSCASFAYWCTRNGIDPHDAGKLLHLIGKALRAGETECNTGQSADAARNAVEEYARTLGLTTYWPGLSPCFRGPMGSDIHPPIL